MKVSIIPPFIQKLNGPFRKKNNIVHRRKKAWLHFCPDFDFENKCLIVTLKYKEQFLKKIQCYLNIPVD